MCNLCGDAAATWLHAYHQNSSILFLASSSIVSKRSGEIPNSPNLPRILSLASTDDCKISFSLDALFKPLLRYVHFSLSGGYSSSSKRARIRYAQVYSSPKWSAFDFTCWHSIIRKPGHKYLAFRSATTSTWKLFSASAPSNIIMTSAKAT